jgi:hypothetical protein
MHLVMLQAVQQYIEVEGGKVVAHKHISIQLAQSSHKHHEQGALVGLQAHSWEGMQVKWVLRVQYF